MNPKDEKDRLTINVEYNVLDRLLRHSKTCDKNDPKTGYSPFPGNTNCFCISLSDYVSNLKRTNGIVPEFVNPKYQDETRTKFKKPTRLECMMQDYPMLLPKDAEVTFCVLPRWFSYVVRAWSSRMFFSMFVTHFTTHFVVRSTTRTPTHSYHSFSNSLLIFKFDILSYL